MQKTVGAFEAKIFEAKIHLSRLLERVASYVTHHNY